MLSRLYKTKLESLKKEFQVLKSRRHVFLNHLHTAELPDFIFNTVPCTTDSLSLAEIQAFLCHSKIPKHTSIHKIDDIHRFKILHERLRMLPPETPITAALLLSCYEPLTLSGAARFRKMGEYIHFSTHKTAPPDQIPAFIQALLETYYTPSGFYVDNIARFHFEFKRIHPFLNYNDVIGMMLLNFQLHQFGLPPVIFRLKDRARYLSAFQAYQQEGSLRPLSTLLALAILESLHKRIAYLKGLNIITLSEFSTHSPDSLNALINQAKRQTLPAFRENGAWMIGAYT